MKKMATLLAGSLAWLAATPATAATAFDPAGDFLPSYTGTKLNDLDVLSFTVLYNQLTSSFTLGWTVNGAIDATTPGLYVIGVNTGTGVNAPFGSIGAGNVVFNQAILVGKDGAATLGGNSIGTASIVGNAASISLAASLFPSTGFAAQNYGWNIWPRGTGTGLAQITDFAPNNGLLAAVAPVPEPSTWALMLLGFGGMGLALRRGHRRRVTPQIA